MWVIVDFCDKNVENSGVVPDNFGKLREIEDFCGLSWIFLVKMWGILRDLGDFSGFCGILQDSAEFCGILRVLWKFCGNLRDFVELAWNYVGKNSVCGFM